MPFCDPPVAIAMALTRSQNRHSARVEIALSFNVAGSIHYNERLMVTHSFLGWIMCMFDLCQPLGLLLSIVAATHFAFGALTLGQETKEGLTTVIISTELGDIEVELNAKAAPKTVENFLRYVDAKMYDGGRFHRTVKLDNQPDNKIKIEVIQAGTAPERTKDDFPPIKLEHTSETKLSHVDGAISMARDGPDTATSDFFICIGEQKELDFGGKRNLDGQGFAAFGRVTKGMEVVKKIQSSPEREQMLSPSIKITSVRRKN